MDEKRVDIFDRIMSLPILRVFEPFYKKYKEILLYLFFGGLAFVLSIGSFAICNVAMGINELIANIVSWILTIIFAFFTNRTWVFESSAHASLLKQLINFLKGRILTLVIEEAILFIFITNFGLGSMIIKTIAQVVVIVLNYVISKLWVFKE